MSDNVTLPMGIGDCDVAERYSVKLAREFMGTTEELRGKLSESDQGLVDSLKHLFVCLLVTHGLAWSELAWSRTEGAGGDGGELRSTPHVTAQSARAELAADWAENTDSAC